MSRTHRDTRRAHLRLFWAAQDAANAGSYRRRWWCQIPRDELVEQGHWEFPARRYHPRKWDRMREHRQERQYIHNALHMRDLSLYYRRSYERDRG